MSLAFKMMLWFGGSWFALRAIDSIWPPHNPVWNAALAIAAMLCCFAEHVERALNNKQIGSQRHKQED